MGATAALAGISFETVSDVAVGAFTNLANPPGLRRVTTLARGGYWIRTNNDEVSVAARHETESRAVIIVQ